MPLEDTGYVARRADDYATLIFDSIEADSGRTLDRENRADNVLTSLVVTISVLLAQLDETAQAAFDMTDPNNATGAAFDNLMALVGLTRRPATYSVVRCGLQSNSPNCFIPAGSLVQGGGTDSKARWALLEDVNPADWEELTAIPPVYSTTALFQCTETGPVAAVPGSITTIVQPQQFWTIVLNVEAATLGSDVESLAAARQRRAASLQGGGSRTLGALRAALGALDGVESVVIVENTSTAETEVEGLTLPGNSVCAVIYPDTLTEDQQTAVAETLYLNLAAGVASAGDESATVTGSDGQTKTIRWQYPTTVTANIAMTGKLAPGFALADVEADVEANATDAVNLLGPGETLLLQDLWAAMRAVTGVRGETVTINGSAANLTCLATQVIVPGTVAFTIAP